MIGNGKIMPKNVRGYGNLTMYLASYVTYQVADNRRIKSTALAIVMFILTTDNAR